MDYEVAVAAHNLASQLGGVSEAHYDAIRNALIEAFNSGNRGDRLL
jgi:hypothetical protein